VGLEMVLEAVRDYMLDTSMYKFGLQALLHFLNRLPEWPEFCQQLVQIPGLEGTEAYSRAQEVLHNTESNMPAETNGVNGNSDGAIMTNGNVDQFLTSDQLEAPFRSIHAEPPRYPDRYEDPEEDVQDKVLFVLNNVGLGRRPSAKAPRMVRYLPGRSACQVPAKLSATVPRFVGSAE
jgi:CCR4-NOT transcription complex subunit 1